MSKFYIRDRDSGFYYKALGEGMTADRAEAYAYSEGERSSALPQDFENGELIKELIPDGPGSARSLVGAEVVTIGDLNSSARGTGARKSAGKPDWSQLPMWAIWPIAEAYVRSDDVPGVLSVALRHMAAWQRGDNDALDKAGAVILRLLAIEDKKAAGVIFPMLPPAHWPIRSLLHVVRVLEFGAKKYAKGNWAKGMSWSVCYTCAVSHISKAMAGEVNDEESGLSHLGHALCNIIFLIGYRDLYPEGDDRLPEFRPAGVKVDLSHD